MKIDLKTWWYCSLAFVWVLFKRIKWFRFNVSFWEQSYNIFLLFMLTMELIYLVILKMILLIKYMFLWTPCICDKFKYYKCRAYIITVLIGHLTGKHHYNTKTFTFHFTSTCCYWLWMWSATRPYSVLTWHI